MKKNVVPIKTIELIKTVSSVWARAQTRTVITMIVYQDTVPKIRLYSTEYAATNKSWLNRMLICMYDTYKDKMIRERKEKVDEG